MKKWLKTRYLIVYALLLLSVLYPMPYEIYLPGGIDDADRIIEINDAYQETGSFHSSYVSVITKPKPFQYVIYSIFNDKVDIEPLDEYMKKLTVDEMNESSHLSKKSSINTSIIVAYTKANKTISYETNGVIVGFRHPAYDAFDAFRVGDIIIEIEDKEIESLDDFLYDLSLYDCNEKFELTVNRNGQLKVIEVSKSRYQDECKLGLILYNRYTKLEGVPNFDILDDSGYGSSAGLMQTLSIYNALTETDISYGKKIAGTGVIDEDGKILPISGIKQKVYGAIKANVDIYFAPNIDIDGENLYLLALEAKLEMNSDIEIVPVKTFDEALNYLNNTFGGK